MGKSPDIGAIALVGPGPSGLGPLARFSELLGEALRQRHPSTRVWSTFICEESDAEGRVTRKGASAEEARVGKRHGEAAHWLNEARNAIDVVSFQPQLETDGLKSAARASLFLSQLEVPVVTSLLSFGRDMAGESFEAVGDLARRSDRLMVPREEDRARLMDRCGVDGNRIDVWPAGGQGPILKELASWHMRDAEERTGDLRSEPFRDADSFDLGDLPWEETAEAYNHCFLKAIILPLRRKCETSGSWPWARERRFSKSAGCIPEWES